MLYRIHQRFLKWLFKAQCSDILSTPSLRIKESQLKIVSMVSHNDLMMYLVAIKSLYFYLGEGEVITGIAPIFNPSEVRRVVGVVAASHFIPKSLTTKPIPRCSTTTRRYWPAASGIR